MRSLVAILAAAYAWFTNAIKVATGWLVRAAMVLFGVLEAAWAVYARMVIKAFPGFRKDTHGAIQTAAINIVYWVIGAVVVVLVLAAVASTFFNGLGGLAENLTTVDLGTSDGAQIAESILGVMVILVLVGGTFAFIGFALNLFGGRKR